MHFCPSFILHVSVISLPCYVFAWNCLCECFLSHPRCAMPSVQDKNAVFRLLYLSSETTCTSKGTQLVLPALEPESCSRVPSFVCKVFTPRLQGRFFCTAFGLPSNVPCTVSCIPNSVLFFFFLALHSFVCMVLLCSPKSHSVFCTLFSERMNVVLQVFVYCFCFAYTCDCTGHIVWN